MFTPVENNVSFPEMEEKIIRFWHDDDIFGQSLKQRQGSENYVFYDGPPFATGLPHYGHLLASTIKDVVPRYQTMRGKYVDRTFGWDCHGLPVENEVEKELDLGSRHDIEAYGISSFNEACRDIVLRYTEEWKTTINRIGRWVDFSRGYKTMDRSYMESIWWVFRRLWDKDLIYEGYKILPYCMRCATPLSNFEANQDYQEIQDPSITVRFQSADDASVYFLAWTTTPWTLPSNLALGVHPDIEYVKVKDGEEFYILARDLVATYYGDDSPPVIETLRGADLVGKQYQPLFPYFADKGDEGAFRIIPATFVGTDSGTGVVHMAPGFGEDDYYVCTENDIPVVCPVDAECRFTEEVHDFEGRNVKETDQDIIRRLKETKQLVHKTSYKHSYPHCWRCESPLIYRAVSTWFVHVEAVKDRMLKANAGIHWVPAHLREGRFGNWLANARDWAVSRNRYWGCPLPIWESEDGEERVCVGSVQELEQLTGTAVTDLHKHYVDNLELPSQAGKGSLKRVPEVLDCWFESGAMPYAQHHYPFENKEFFEQHFPADFIAEGLDQTRGWFYTLVVLAAALFDRPPFRNVVVNGLVLAEDGRKMSKRWKNYPDPAYIMDTYGADALRVCLLSSPVVRGEDLCFSERKVREEIRTLLMPVWNAYSFLVTYARVDGWEPAPHGECVPAAPMHVLDRWILSRLHHTVSDVRASMDDYDLQSAATRFTSLVEDLTNWYIRRSRRRFWKSENDADKAEAYATLHAVLLTFTKIAAPFMPFMTEEIYRNLRTAEMPQSVHLCDFPQVDEARLNPALDEQMQAVITAVSLGRYLRAQAQVKVRQPLRQTMLVSADDTMRANLDEMKNVIAEELNVKEIQIHSDEEALVDLTAKPNYKSLGPRLGKRMRAAAQSIAALPAASIRKLRQGEAISLPIDDGGEAIELTPEDITVERHEKEGMPVANQGSITVAIDTTLDNDLIQEGWARELINRIQNMRKANGYEVTDHIKIRYALPTDIEKALQAFSEHVAAETLATSLEPAPLGQEYLVTIEGRDCRIALEKVD